MSKQHLISTLYDKDRAFTLGTLEPPGFIDSDDPETSKWFPYYAGLMPLTQWLVTSIMPLLRMDFINEAKPGTLKGKLPKLDIKEVLKDTGDHPYARGFGGQSVFGTMFENVSQTTGRLQHATLKEGQSTNPLLRRTKTGYAVTAALGFRGFFKNMDKPVFSVLDSMESDRASLGVVSAWHIGSSLGVNGLMIMPADLRAGFHRLLGDDFYDAQKSYHRTFKLGKKFTKYLAELVDNPVQLVVEVINSLGGVSAPIVNLSMGDAAFDAEGDFLLQAYVEDYLNWLDLHLTEFDLTAPAMVAGTVPEFTDSGYKEKILITSLSETSKFKEAIIHPNAIRGIQMYAGNNDLVYSVMDCYMDSVVTHRDVTLHLMLDMPKDVALFNTGNDENTKVDEYYLAQITDRAFSEFLEWDPINDRGDIVQNFGDQTILYFSAQPVEKSIALLSKRKVPERIGVNAKGLGVDASGNILYIPRELNDYAKYKEAYEQFFESSQEHPKKFLFGLRDVFDIDATRKVVGKSVEERPRPDRNLGGLSSRPLFVDWSTNTLIGADHQGRIFNMMDLNDITPLIDRHVVNYRKAVVYPITTNGYGSLSYRSAIADAKINVENAITIKMHAILNGLIKKLLTADEIATYALGQMTQMVSEVFPDELQQGIQLPTLEYYANQIKTRFSTNDPLSAFHDPTYAFHNNVVKVAHNVYGSEDSFPEILDDHVAIAKEGSGYFLTLERISKSGDDHCLLSRIIALVIERCWMGVKDKLPAFFKNSSPHTGFNYYGTLKFVAETIKAPPSFQPVVFDSTVPVPNDYVPQPLPGSREGYALLPHQLRVDNATSEMSKMGVSSYVLNIDAGGGKTHLILNDVVRKLDNNEIKRPLIVCPGYLVKNYIEDAIYIYEGRINVVPIVTLTKNYNPLVGNSDPLGLDGLQTIIYNAPKNTIGVTSSDFLSNGASLQIPCGTDLKELNAHVELLLTGDFDYVAADESHDLRNPDAIKSTSTLAVFYRAKFRVLATGTFLNTTPADIPSQARLLDPTVFGSQRDFIDYYGEPDTGTKGNRISRLREGRKDELVQSMRNTMGYIQVQRKEWVSLLPERKDAYHIVQLDEQSPQWKMYQAVLTQVLTEIETILKQNKSLEKGDAEGDEESMQAMENLLNPYLARLEMLLITPYLDPDFEQLMTEIGMDVENGKSWVSPAVERAIEIMQTHIYGVSTEQLKTIPAEERADAIADYKSYTGGDDSVDGTDLLIDHIPACEGKILVFCNYNSSVDAVYDALPPDLKKMAIRYRASNKDADIFEFKNNPNKKILIGIQTSLSTGHNLQMATRLIRLENCWSPGELEQGESRINRPDPKNKGAQRSRIYYDFILMDGTISITKASRLISRLIVNQQVNEYGNPLYKSVPFMELLVMNLNVIRNNCWLVAPSDESAGTLSTRSLKKYLEVKRQIDNIQREDNRRFVANYTGVTTPVEVPSKDIMEGSKILSNIPSIPGQAVAQADKFELVNVAKFETMQGKQNLDLVGMRCYTSEGDGTIVSQRGSKVQVDVQGKKYSFDRLSINLYLNTQYSKADIIKSIGIKDVIKVDGSPDSAATKVVKTDKKPKPILPETDEQLVEPKVVKTTKKAPIPQPTEDDGVPDGVIDIFAANINGALGLIISSEDADLYARKNAKFLKDLGFYEEPEVWYAEMPTKKVLNAFIAKMEEKFNIPQESLDLLYEMLDAFSVGRKRLFDATHSSIAEIKEYWLADYRRALKKDPNVLMPIPYVEDGKLFIMLDTSLPSSKRAKRIRVEQVSWETSGGLWLKLYSTKAAAVQDLKVIQTKFDIADKAELKSQMRDVTILSSKRK